MSDFEKELEIKKVSIPSSGSIQFLPGRIVLFTWVDRIESQSPQAGQFNSYRQIKRRKKWKLISVSIPSSGSIQFLPWYQSAKVNLSKRGRSQSPQAGQFNSYFGGSQSYCCKLNGVSIPSSGSIQFLLKHALTLSFFKVRVSIPSSGSIQFLH